MPTKNKKSKQKSSGPSFITIFCAMFGVAVVVFGGLSIYHLANKPKNNETQIDNINTAEVVNNPTETSGDENRDDIKDIKDLIDEGSQKPEVEVADGLKVPTFDVTIRQNNGMTIISGKITNFIETDGSCTYILTGPTTKNISKSVLPDPKYTVCEALVFNRGELATGSWQVKVEYKSQTAGGVSETQTFTIQ